VQSLVSRLEQSGLKPPLKWDWKSRAEPLSSDELGHAVSVLNSALPELDELIEAEQARLFALEPAQELARIDARSLVGECVEYTIDVIGDGGDSELEYARNQLRRALDEHFQEHGDETAVLTLAEQEFVIKAAIFLKTQRKFEDLTNVRDGIQQMDLAARLWRPDTELSIYRQGFILLMTAFDAAVFDLVRFALRKDFFSLIASFGKQEKIGLDELAAYQSFDAFRDAQVERQLKGRYLKEVLSIVKGWDVKLTGGAADKFVHIVELVLRRNVHIHNRGEVDERYLERDQNGTPRFNLYNLTLGSVAHIDEAYWSAANRLCGNAVAALATWIENSPRTTAS
jgi:hypothetical protein